MPSATFGVCGLECMGSFKHLPLSPFLTFLLLFKIVAIIWETSVGGKRFHREPLNHANAFPILQALITVRGMSPFLAFAFHICSLFLW